MTDAGEDLGDGLGEGGRPIPFVTLDTEVLSLFPPFVQVTPPSKTYFVKYGVVVGCHLSQVWR